MVLVSMVKELMVQREPIVVDQLFLILRMLRHTLVLVVMEQIHLLIVELNFMVVVEQVMKMMEIMEQLQEQVVQ